MLPTPQNLRRGPLLLLAALLLTPTVSAQGEPPPSAATHSLQALRLEQPITLDGRLDDPAWQRAEIATGFTQREPEPGAPASERTEVQVAYTEKTLYVAVHAFDADPGAIIAREMQRDGGLFRDDSVIVLLDTFDDDRNTYFFETNALGARTDSLVTDEGRDTNFEWDGVWDVAARRTGDGWVAELAIPFSTLRFDPQAEAWGFNVRRNIRHKNEDAFWAPIGLDADLFRVSLYGALTGIEGARPGLSLNVKPFAVAATISHSPPSGGTSTTTAAPQAEDGDDFDAGLDVKWGVTRGLSLDLTLNTDFAETEVDDSQVNLTRFSLFFPEKREFFLENSGIFELGSDPGSDSPLLKVFFSRRIGIGEGGREVPIEGGLRLTGRAGAWNLGVLGVATEALAPSVGPPEGGQTRHSAGTPSNTWGALRLKRNVGQRSSVGLIVTDREGEDGDSNLVFGADFDWKPTDRLALNGFFAQSDDSDLVGGEDWAAGAGVEWSGSIWSAEGGYVEIGERFEPEMGFLRRRGVRRYTGGVEYEPRPDLPWLRNFNFELEAEVFTLRDGTTESSEFQLEPLSIRFKTEDRITLFVERNFERLFEPFEITDGVIIPAGDYTYYDYGVSFDTNDGRTLTADGSIRWSGFFDGDRFRAEATLRIRPNRFVRSETTWQYNDVDLPGGAFTATVLRERLSLAASPRLRADTFLQYNDLDELFAANVRFNWIYKPGADLFVVFNQTWDAPSLGDLDRRDRQVIVKFTYLWQR
ncbi:MAG: carbohydrate binding family 9 domain-containing protein [bacterium]|nr:carbohydrate binding family 9 domain-containing protein [bacterium]